MAQVTPGLWKHVKRTLSFTLCVDHFGVKYVGREQAKHLANVLNEHYKCLQEVGEQVSRDDYQLGLQQARSAHSHAQICSGSPFMIPTKQAKQATTPTIPAHQTKKMRKGTIC